MQWMKGLFAYKVTSFWVMVIALDFGQTYHSSERPRSFERPQTPSDLRRQSDKMMQQ